MTINVSGTRFFYCIRRSIPPPDPPPVQYLVSSVVRANLLKDPITLPRLTILVTSSSGSTSFTATRVALAFQLVPIDVENPQVSESAELGRD